MQIPSHQLEAFYEIAQKKSFTLASKALHVTQAALSLRLKSLEDSLQTTLLSRHDFSLTSTGEQLFYYCLQLKELENDCLNQMNESKSTGIIRIGAYSSIARSLILPAIAPLSKNHHTELKVGKMKDLIYLLKNNQIDYAFLDEDLNDPKLEKIKMGEEEYVVISSAKKPGPLDHFLDNDENDQATLQFFKKQKINYRRSFYHDCYGIIDAVIMGIGVAVMPKHLVLNNPKIKILSEYKSKKMPIYLYFYNRPYYPQIHNKLLKLLPVNSF